MRAAQQVQAQLAGGLVGERLHRQGQELLADHAMLEELEQTRLELASVKDGYADDAALDLAYAKAFRNYGIEVDRQGLWEATARKPAKRR